MLSGLLGRPKATLRVIIARPEVAFVHPREGLSTAGGEPLRHWWDPTVNGTVKVSSTGKALDVASLSVRLKGVCQIKHEGIVLEEWEPYDRTLDLNLTGQLLEAGEHSFEFSFTIPTSTPCSSHDSHWRVNYQASASMTFSGDEKSIASPPAQVYVFAGGEGEPGDLPDPFNVAHEHLGEDLGPVRLNLFSPHLTLGSLISVRVDLATAPRTLRIISVQPFSTCTTRVRPRNPKHPERKYTDKHNLLLVEDDGQKPSLIKAPLLNVPVPQGSRWAYSNIFQLPQCFADVSPTTFAETDSNTRYSYKITVEIRYVVEGSPVIKFSSLSVPATIVSCTSLLESYTLPTYTLDPPAIEPRFSYMRDGILCLCEYHLGETMDRYRDVLTAAGLPDVIADAREARDATWQFKDDVERRMSDP